MALRVQNAGRTKGTAIILYRNCSTFRAMDRGDFKIGSEFQCSGKAYRCTDIGTRAVIAIRIGSVDVAKKCENTEIIYSRLSRDEAEAEGWFDGPPYAVVEYVFDENDLEACEQN